MKLETPMEPELKAYLDKIASQLVADVKREIADMETRLRSEFSTRVNTAEIRYKRYHDVIACIDERVMAIETRLMELEYKRALELARSRPPLAPVDRPPSNPPV